MRVDIWSDVVCPWCYIGKRRFERALQAFPQRDQVELVWRSFQLDPTAGPSPEQPGKNAERLARKYGVSLEQARGMEDNVTRAAADEGLDFRFDISRTGNTFDAHRLLHLGLKRGVQDELKERLDHGTFSEGLAVSDHDALAKVAVDVGLAPAEVEQTLESDAFANDVRTDLAQAKTYGIRAVPFFVIDDKYGVAGAQDPSVLLEILQRAWEESAPLKVIGDAAAEACDDDSCVI